MIKDHWPLVMVLVIVNWHSQSRLRHASRAIKTTLSLVF